MSFVVAVVTILALLPVARSQAVGIAPGSFVYRLHATVPLLTVKDANPYFQRVADPAGLYGAPFAEQAGEPADMSVLSVLKISSADAVLDGSEVPQETIAELPPGAIARFGDVVPCGQVEFLQTIDAGPGGCPAASQVGVMSFPFGGALADRTYPLYKLAAGHGHLATLGFPYDLVFQPVGVLVNADLRADGDYGITLSSTRIGFPKFAPAPFMTIWGVPAAAAHDPERWNPETLGWGDSVGGPAAALIANATDCEAGTREARTRLRYWNAPERWLPDDPEDPAYRSLVPEPVGCERLRLEPRAELSPSSDRADSPAGIELRLELPPDSGGLATPPLEAATLALPEGMSVNPAVADGLAACTPEQIGLESGGSLTPEQIRFSAAEPRCPAAAKVGVGVIDTPLAEDPLEGDVYFATPFDNPFHSPLALYLVFDGPGFTVKLAAGVEADPVSGRLEASLGSLPPLPVDAVELSLAGGPRAPLATPPGCGEAPLELRLTPSSAPQSGPPARVLRSYAVSRAPGGGACAAAVPPGSLLAGSRDPAAGRSTPFLLHLERSPIGAFEVTLPRGLVARVAGVERCSEANIGGAEARGAPGEGALERRDPSCPAGSRVGSLLVGPGPGPLSAPGSLYLAGPYRGAPFSLVAITPALAGGSAGEPLFDLGTVVDRVALRVNRRTGAVTASAAAPPRALGGIPLRIASVTAVLDRPGFVHNPSGCGPMSVTADVEGWAGARSSLRSAFRAVGCKHLGFAPRLRLAALGGRARGQHPTLRAVLRAGAGEAGIAAARVTLPGAELLDHERLHGNSIRGHARAWSGLLGEPLEGPVRLRRARRGPPELVLALGGEAAMEIAGRVRSGKRGARVDFSGLPDAQLSRLEVTLWGGRRGFLANARDLCETASHAIARLVSHGGAVRVRRVAFAAPCGAAGKRPGRDRQIAKRTEG